MSKTAKNETQTAPSNGRALRLVSDILAGIALFASFYLARDRLGMATSTTVQPLVWGHAPVLLGLPFLVALATAIVCGARALEQRPRVELVRLRAPGAGAADLSWILIFSALAVALWALW